MTASTDTSSEFSVKDFEQMLEGDQAGENDDLIDVPDAHQWVGVQADANAANEANASNTPESEPEAAGEGGESGEVVVDVAASDEPALEVAPPDPADRLDRLAEIVEKLAAAKSESELPTKAGPERTEPTPLDYLAAFERDPEFRVACMRKYGYTQPESWENPHAINDTYRALADHAREYKLQQQVAKIEAWERREAERAEQLAAESRGKEAETKLVSALSTFAPLPAKAQTAFVQAVRSAVSRGVDIDAAIASVVDTFGELFPKKVAPPAAPVSPTRQGARPASQTQAATRPAQTMQRRDAAIANPNRTPRGRTTLSELERFERGDWYTN